jgi:excisionase family DNA binding protein
MSDLAVTLTIQELEQLIERAVRRVAATAPAESKILTRAQVAELLQVHAVVVSRYVAEEDLPAHKVGGEYRFVRSEVMAWVTSKKGAA